MFLLKLHVFHADGDGFRAPKTAAKKHSQHCSMAFPAKCV
jgi:hypothetical protein